MNDPIVMIFALFGGLCFGMFLGNLITTGFGGGRRYWEYKENAADSQEQKGTPNERRQDTQGRRYEIF